MKIVAPLLLLLAAPAFGASPALSLRQSGAVNLHTLTVADAYGLQGRNLVFSFVNKRSRFLNDWMLIAAAERSDSVRVSVFLPLEPDPPEGKPVRVEGVLRVRFIPSFTVNGRFIPAYHHFRIAGRLVAPTKPVDEAEEGDGL